MRAGSVPWLGVVADDVTGAVDLAGAVADAGLSTRVLLGARPGREDGEEAERADCVVVALTTRTAPVERAVAETSTAARRLLDDGVQVLYQKYCSTFDSSDGGNIGPVADSLAALVGPGPGWTVGTPATPAVGRTQYLGHLFVGKRLLSESPLRDHPLTPMRDPDLVRVLTRQTTGQVSLLPLTSVRAGAAAVAATLDELTAPGTAVHHVLVDAVEDVDLDTVARAILHARTGAVVVGGGAGLAAALARRWVGDSASDGTSPGRHRPQAEDGPALVVAGSCSERTREQVLRHTGPRHRLSAPDLARDLAGEVDRAVGHLARTWSSDPTAVPLLYSTADPERVRAEQAEVGARRAADLVERALGQAARRAVHEHGARRLLVAGGETSGAVTDALGVTDLAVGPLVEPGLPWTVTTTTPRLALLLKSGNFGTPDLFTTAWETCP